MEFIAHYREKDKKNQSLWVHLQETSLLAGEFASKIGLKKHGELLGLLHDLGKATQEFDQYIRSAVDLIDPDEDDYIDVTGKKGKIDHSTAGAQIINLHFSGKGNDGLIASQILSIAIASHHSGLIDALTPNGEDNFSRRINKSDKKTRAKEALSNLNDKVRHKMEELLSDRLIISQLRQKLLSLQEENDSKETLTFKIGLLTRFLFSCLIDADRLDTANFEFPEAGELRNKVSYVSWSVLIEKLNSYLSKFDNQSDENIKRRKVNALRQDISNQCFKFSSKPKGLYQLTVPTGGGKTLASLRFALNHANKHKMDRIFYIIPFTSIIDQNAETAREVLEDKTDEGKFAIDVVLEHHSNLTPDEENTQQRLLSENWDAPVIFTTMVQFLEALFGFGTRNARRMHQLANSIIIFDEIQTLPIKCVHLFNVAIRFLVQNCGSTVVLSTATQPLLNEVKPKERALHITTEQQMVSDVQKLFKELKRVEVYDQRKIGGWTYSDLINLIDKEINETGSVLVVVNTKKSARELFQQVKSHLTTQAFHLSTNMCPAHRIEVLNDIRKYLEKKEPVICISTQLIEAGVDIDFGSVIRYLAGLDSITQAAGRCNRNGARPQLGRVFVINPQEENLDRLIDIKEGRDIAERILDEYKTDPEQFGGDLLSPKVMERYYQYYFFKRANIMNYPVGSNSVVGRSDDLFELLSTNTKTIQEFQRINQSYPQILLRQSFMAAAKSFEVIGAPTRGVVVPYKEGAEIITELCAADNLEKQYKLLKRAQRYSVNVFPDLFDRLFKQKIIREAQKGTGVFYLDTRYYNDEYGMSESVVNEMEVLQG